MGSGIASGAVASYLVKYCTKDTVSIKAAASVLADAQGSVQRRAHDLQVYADALALTSATKTYTQNKHII